MHGGKSSVRESVPTKNEAVSSPAPAKRDLAHVRRDEDGSFAIHDLEEHLRAVAGIVQCAIAGLALEGQCACA